MNTHLSKALLTIAASLCAASALAQSYSIGWSTIDGGGGPSSGGSYSLNGTIGQPNVGASSGGVFSASGGFWVPDSLGTLPRLSIRRGTGNNVILSWPNPSTGYVLQQTANMNGPGGGWMDVPQSPVITGTNKEVTLTATGAFCLFRLRKL